MTKQNYGDSSIHVFLEHEAVRRSPEQYLGTKGVEGARHTIFEITGNATDEAESGYGDKIVIEYTHDNVVSVRDFGRGVPMGFNEKHNMMNWFAIYARRDAGGKYGDNQELLEQVEDWSTFDPKSIPYLYSIGLYGVGASITQFTSEFCRVSSYRDGVETYMEFSEGQPVVPEEFQSADKMSLYEAPTRPTTEPNGTRVTWRPSDKVFWDTNISLDFLKEVCEGISYIAKVHAELHYTNEDGETTVIDYPVKSIEDFNKNTVFSPSFVLGSSINLETFAHGRTTVKSAGGNKSVIYVLDIEASIIPTSEAGVITVYHNGMKIKGGVHFDAIEDALLSLLKDAGASKVTRQEVFDKVNVVIKTKSNHTDFDGADKSSILSTFIYQHVYNEVFQELSKQYQYKTASVVNLVKLITDRVSERLELEARRKEIRQATSNTKKAKATDIVKFAPSTNYVNRKYDNSELWLPEGDSAGGQAKSARNIQFQSVLPTFGKPVNATKLSDTSALNRVFVKTLLQLLGAGVHIPSMPDESTYDTSKERFDKIIIFSDADIDGQHIRAMIFLIVLLYAPEIIRRGKLYVCIPPLYRITYTDGTKGYAVDLKERDEVIAKSGKSVREISYLKGIGEMNTDDTEICLNPATRKLVQLQADPYDPELLAMIMEMFGSSPAYRRSVLGYILGLDFEKDDAIAKAIAKSIEDDDTLEDDIDENFIVY